MQYTTILPTSRGINADRNINVSPIKIPTYNLHLMSRALHHVPFLLGRNVLRFLRRSSRVLLEFSIIAILFGNGTSSHVVHNAPINSVN